MKRKTLTAVQVVRYGNPSLGTHLFGIFDWSREEIIKRMKEYNEFRGGKYPTIHLTTWILNDDNRRFQQEEVVDLLKE